MRLRVGRAVTSQVPIRIGRLETREHNSYGNLNSHPARLVAYRQNGISSSTSYKRRLYSMHIHLNLQRSADKDRRNYEKLMAKMELKKANLGPPVAGDKKFTRTIVGRPG